MKILFDECFPRTLKRFVNPQYETTWTQDTSFRGAEDRHLLEEAVAAGFEVFITVDQNLPYQQQLEKFNLAIINILTLSNAAPRLKAVMPKLNEILQTIKAGEFVVLKTEEYEEMERKRQNLNLPQRRKK
jgi:predicted nuclease of predicted toxin-antitoxin system